MMSTSSAVPFASIYRICLEDWQSDSAVSLQGFGGETAIQGVDARKLDVATVIRHARELGLRMEVGRIRRREGYSPSATQLACAVGHRLVYRRIIDRRAPYAIVLEEDALLTGSHVDTQALISILESEEPRIVQLACRGEIFPDHRRPKAGVGDLVPLRYPPRQTTAYAINAAAAHLGLLTPVDGLADWPGFATLVNFWAHTPWPFTEADTASTIKIGSRSSHSEGGGPIAQRPPLRWDHLFRSFLPRLESRLWRSRGRPRVGPTGELWTPTMPAPAIHAVRTLARHQVGRHYANSTRSLLTP